MDDASAPDLTAPLWHRLLWFASLWAGSVLSLGVVAGILRTWLKAS